MDTNTTTHSQEIATSKDFESLYYELEKQIVTLIADDEKEDLVGGMTANQSTHVWINRPRHLLEQQNTSYLHWKCDFHKTADFVNVWNMNSWRNASHGTGVFIPRTGKENNPSRRCKGKGRRDN